MKLSKKRITESEFEESLTNCANIAKKAYERNFEYLQQAENIIEKLNENLRENLSKLLNEKDAEHFELYEDVKKKLIKFMNT